MLSVTHLDGRSEPLIDIQNAEIEEEVNGAFSLSFTSFFMDRKNPGYELLEEESIVDLDGHEFRVIDLSQKRLNKSITGNHIFFDLVHHKVEGIQGGTRTVEEQATFILNGSGWTWEVQGDIPPQLFLDSFGNSDAVTLIKTMCETLQCERQIMPGRHIIFAKEIGKDDDFQFRSKHNIKDITRSVSTTDLVTAIKATGADGTEVEYRAPTAELHKINGKYRYADPVTNEEMTSIVSLMEFAKQELGDRWMPQISIDVPVMELSEQGYEGEAALGDRVWLVEDTIGILFKTRVMKRKWNPFVKNKINATLANVKPTFSDILVETKVEIDKNAKEFRSKIEQTNERITLEVERLDGDILEAYARIQIESDRITSEVGRLDGDILTANSRITQLADSVTIEVQRIDEDLSELNTQVQFNAGEISLMVRETDFNGVEMISRINQTAESVKILAKNIDLLGITTVADTLFLGDEIGGEKNIHFSNFSRITSLNNGDLELEANGDLHLSAIASLSKVRFDNDVGVKSIVDLSTAEDIIYGTNTPPSVDYADEAGYAETAGSANTAGNAWQLGGYNANQYSRSGHDHYGDYIGDRFGQYLELYIDNATGRLVVLRDGFNEGSVALT